MSLNPITLYCSQTDLANLLSSVGVTLRVDDNEDGLLGAAEQQAITDCLTEASETVNYYCWNKYSPEALATSSWVNRCATILAAYALSHRRENEAGASLTDRAVAYEDKLLEIRDKNGLIPNTPLRQNLAPVWSNTRVVPWPYSFRCIRVERQNSSQTSSTLPTNTDYQEQYAYDRR